MLRLRSGKPRLPEHSRQYGADRLAKGPMQRLRPAKTRNGEPRHYRRHEAQPPASKTGPVISGSLTTNIYFLQFRARSEQNGTRQSQHYRKAGDHYGSEHRTLREIIAAVCAERRWREPSIIREQGGLTLLPD
jgi:hypothetical protein